MRSGEKVRDILKPIPDLKALLFAPFNPSPRNESEVIYQSGSECVNTNMEIYISGEGGNPSEEARVFHRPFRKSLPADPNGFFSDI